MRESVLDEQVHSYWHVLHALTNILSKACNNECDGKYTFRQTKKGVRKFLKDKKVIGNPDLKDRIEDAFASLKLALSHACVLNELKKI